MITYLYWIAVTATAGGFLYLLVKAKKGTIGVGVFAAIMLVGWAANFFYFEQIFVKRYGGVMSITVPAGQQHITATWKDDNLWVENYDPASNTCYFNEYSRGSLLQGQVTIKNCNPTRLEPNPD
jgi:hypothetical protein